MQQEMPPVLNLYCKL